MFELYSTTQTAWNAMYEALKGATRSILWEVYIFADDRAGQRFVDLLVEKAQANVEVKLIVDTIGGRFLSKTAIDRLRAAGVMVLFYNPVHFEWRLMRWVARLWYRNHRKVLIIDEITAFMGGVNITFTATEWNDLHVRLDGPVVAPLIRDFAETFVASGGERAAVSRYLSADGAKSERPVGWERFMFLAMAPHRGSDRRFVRSFYLKAVARAQKKFTLITPYYIPYKKFLNALVEARRRGVEVEIITPLRSDHRFLDYMAYYFLEVSERLGATIYLLPKMNHAKGFLVDGEAGLVGSSNFTKRSFFANAESDVYFTEPGLVEPLRQVIEEWKSRSAHVAESGQKKRRIRTGIVNWLVRYFQDYV